MTDETLPLLGSSVQKLMMACLAEVVTDEGQVRSVARTFCFDSAKIQEHKKAIRSLWMQLDPTFRVSGGGGWSFLYIPQGPDGDIWCQQIEADALVALGIAAGFVSFPIEDRAMWNVLPGAVPYVMFDDSIAVD